MSFYRDEHHEPRFESGYEKGCKDTKDEMQEVIDEMLETGNQMAKLLEDVSLLFAISGKPDRSEVCISAVDMWKEATRGASDA